MSHSEAHLMRSGGGGQRGKLETAGQFGGAGVQNAIVVLLHRIVMNNLSRYLIDMSILYVKVCLYLFQRLRVGSARGRRCFLSIKREQQLVVFDKGVKMESQQSSWKMAAETALLALSRLRRTFRRRRPAFVLCFHTFQNTKASIDVSGLILFEFCVNLWHHF